MVGRAAVRMEARMSIPRRFASRFISAIFLAACLLAAPAAHAASNDVFFGYSRTGNDTFYPNVGGLNGWDAALHIHTAPFLGIEADVSHYGMGASATVPRTTSVLFGPRFTVGAAGVRIFAHGLIGGEHSANSGGGVHISGGSFAYALGGGLDVPIAPFFAWRVEGDRISAPAVSPSNGTPVRFSTGLVFRF